jgi:hypothetical protein
MKVLNKFPSRFHSLVFAETLPKFDVEGSVIAVAHFTEPRHHEAAFFIDIFSCDTCQ